MKGNSKPYTLALIALLTLSAYLLADTVDAMIGRSLDATAKVSTPVNQERAGIVPRKELSDYSSILERGLFGDGKGPSSGPAAAETYTAYTLIGTIEGESFAGAVLADATNQQAFYRRGEKLPDGARIVKVNRDRVSLKRPDGETVEIQIVDDTKIVNVAKAVPPANGVRKVGEGRFMVDQREIASSTESTKSFCLSCSADTFTEVRGTWRPRPCQRRMSSTVFRSAQRPAARIIPVSSSSET